MFKPKSQETLNNCTDKKKMFIIRSLKFRQEQYRCSSGFRRIQPDPEFKNSYVYLTGACTVSVLCELVESLHDAINQYLHYQRN